MMAKESMVVAEQLRLLHNSVTGQPPALSGATFTCSLPPHLNLISISTRKGCQSACLPTTGLAAPADAAACLATTVFPSADASASTIAAPTMGVPHPGEATHE